MTAIAGQRAAVVAEAESWESTPYHHMGRLKGVGCDCLSLLAEVYERAGVIGHVDIPFYPGDWQLHRDAERYLEGILQYAHEIEGPPEPGDIAVWKFGRTFSHGAIVTEWPRVIHAFVRVGVVRGDANAAPLKGRPVRFFSAF